MSWSAIVAVFLATTLVLAQDGIERGKLKSVDAERGVVVVTVNGKERSLSVDDSTRFMDVEGQAIRGGLADPRFKSGVDVAFKLRQQDGKSLLIGLKLFREGGPPPIAVDTSKLKALADLGKDKYQGFGGGLYPDGENVRPPKHEAAGLARAKKVQPLDSEGQPSPRGRIVVLSIGMSNTSQLFTGFQQGAADDRDLNPQLVLVNGAQGGMTASRTRDPDDGGGGTKFWKTVDDRLRAANVSRSQVQVAWIKQADAGPSSGFPAYARTLQAELADIVQVLQKRFPNLQMVYLSSRTYAGYAQTRLNPEPYAYESGFAVKWLIEQQLKGDRSLNYDAANGTVTAPWLSWGPYLWVNGTNKRADGYFAAAGDFAKDGTHHDPSGVKKLAGVMLQFFKTDTTTKGWFLKSE
jgi:hypothetical protein